MMGTLMMEMDVIATVSLKLGILELEAILLIRMYDQHEEMDCILLQKAVMMEIIMIMTDVQVREA
jgi:hypothetical protein